MRSLSKSGCHVAIALTVLISISCVPGQRAPDSALTPTPSTSTVGDDLGPTSVNGPLRPVQTDTPSSQAPLTATDSPVPTPAPTATQTPTPTPLPAPTEIPSPTPSLPTSAAITERRIPPDTVAALQEIELRVREIRGLKGAGDPRRRFVGYEELEDVLDQMGQDPAAETELKNAQAVLRMLGLIPPEADSFEFGPLDFHVFAGVYTPEDQQIFLVRDFAGPDDPLDEYEEEAYAHEYVHFLQWTSFGVDPTYGSPINDSSAAKAAVIEGDADVTAKLYSALAQTGEDLTNLSADDVLDLLDKLYSDEWSFYSDPLSLTYSQGQAFVVALFRHVDRPDLSGAELLKSGFQLVDEALQRSDMTSELILHPEKYLAGELLVAVELPDLAATLGPGWEPALESDFGEQFLRGWLEYLVTDFPHEATTGWGGDSYALWRDSTERYSLAGRIAWDTESGAQQFATELSRGLDMHREFRRIGGQTGEFGTSVRPAVWHGPSGYLAIALSSPTEIDLVAAPTVEIATLVFAALVPEATWSGKSGARPRLPVIAEFLSPYASPGNATEPLRHDPRFGPFQTFSNPGGGYAIDFPAGMKPYTDETAELAVRLQYEPVWLVIWKESTFRSFGYAAGLQEYADLELYRLREDGRWSIGRYKFTTAQGDEVEILSYETEFDAQPTGVLELIFVKGDAARRIAYWYDLQFADTIVPAILLSFDSLRVTDETARRRPVASLRQSSTVETLETDAGPMILYRSEWLPITALIPADWSSVSPTSTPEIFAEYLGPDGANLTILERSTLLDWKSDSSVENIKPIESRSVPDGGRLTIYEFEPRAGWQAARLAYSLRGDVRVEFTYSWPAAKADEVRPMIQSTFDSFAVGPWP